MNARASTETSTQASAQATEAAEAQRVTSAPVDLRSLIR